MKPIAFKIEHEPTTYGKTMFLDKSRILELCRDGIALVPLMRYDNPNFTKMKDGEKMFVRYATGNSKHTITFAGRNRGSSEHKVIYGKLTKRTELKYRKIHAIHCKWGEVLNIYRGSKLISKVVAKKHARSIRAKYGDEFYKGNETALNELLVMSARYIVKYSKCPHCGARVEEHIAGFSCRGKVQHVFDTYHGAYWHEMPDPAEIADIPQRVQNQAPYVD